MSQSILDLTLTWDDPYCNIKAEVGGNSTSIDVDMLPDTFSQNIAQLQKAILQSSGSRAAGPEDEPTKEKAGWKNPAASNAQQVLIQQIGSQLFDFAFARGVRTVYTMCYEDALRQQQPVLIRLTTKSPELACLPWETLFDSAHGQHITTSEFTEFLRWVPSAVPQHFRATEAPIRLLGMAARPKTLNGIPLDMIDAETEKLGINTAFSKLMKDGKINLCWTPTAKSKDINRSISGGDSEGRPWDIFHFIGHGGYDKEQKKGFIIVQEEGGTGGKRLYSSNLKELLIKRGRTPNLVVLNSCSGASTDPGSDLFSSTAVDLVQGGVAAVIAMQFEISDLMGQKFSEAFYTYLSLKQSVQQALANTRVELKNEDLGEWVSPVLYMSTPGGTIFRDDGTGRPQPQRDAR